MRPKKKQFIKILDNKLKQYPSWLREELRTEIINDFDNNEI